MTDALLLYRPKGIRLLQNVLNYRRTEDVKRSFIGNTLCYLLRAVAPKFERQIYSDFIEKLEGRGQQEDERTGREIIDDLRAKLRSLRKEPKNESV